MDSYRADIRALFTRLATETGAPDPPTTLGRQLHLLYDGAIISGQLDRDPPSITVAARAAVAALLDAALL